MNKGISFHLLRLLPLRFLIFCQSGNASRWADRRGSVFGHVSLKVDRVGAGMIPGWLEAFSSSRFSFVCSLQDVLHSHIVSVAVLWLCYVRNTRGIPLCLCERLLVPTDLACWHRRWIVFHEDASVVLLREVLGRDRFVALRKNANR